MRVSKLLLMAQFLSKCGLFLQKARLAHLKAEQSPQGYWTLQRCSPVSGEVLGALKGNTPRYFIVKSTQSNRSHMLETLKNAQGRSLQWSNSYVTHCMTLVENTPTQHIMPKVLNPIPPLSLRLGTFQFWSLIPAHPECGHFIFWTRKEDCHRGCLQSIQGPRKRNPFWGWTFSFRCFQFDFLSS